jgi:hypothetical protein
MRAPRRFVLRDLVPLLYRLALACGWREVDAALDGYGLDSGAPKRDRALRYQVLRRCRQRIGEYRRRPEQAATLGVSGEVRTS